MLRNKLVACLLLLLLLSLSSWTIAQTQDNKYQAQQNQITTLEQKVQNVEKQNSTFDSQLKELKVQVASLLTENNSLSLALQQNQQTIDSLAKIVAMNSENIQATADSLGIKLQTTHEAVSQTSDSLKAKTIWGIVAFIFAILASVVVWLLHKKGQKTADNKITSLIQQADESNEKIISLKQQADELNEKIVGQFSNEMNELQKIGDALNNASANTSTEPDHSLVKKLVDRINFMEMTLSRMDSTVRGYNSLKNAINVMKIRLKDNDYEIIDWIGKQYDEGFNFDDVDFDVDYDLEEGQRIITEVLQPQINYRGKMIQAAKVKVKQNINE